MNFAQSVDPLIVTDVNRLFWQQNSQFLDQWPYEINQKNIRESGAIRERARTTTETAIRGLNAALAEARELVDNGPYCQHSSLTVNHLLNENLLGLGPSPTVPKSITLTATTPGGPNCGGEQIFQLISSIRAHLNTLATLFGPRNPELEALRESLRQRFNDFETDYHEIATANELPDYTILPTSLCRILNPHFQTGPLTRWTNFQDFGLTARSFLDSIQEHLHQFTTISNRTFQEAENFSIPAPIGPTQFCQIHDDPENVLRLANMRENRMGFENPGGKMNMGLCWWHSMVQQGASYLAYYEPSKPRPSRQEARAIIRQMMRARTVVEIPGFANLEEFSSDPEFQEVFEDVMSNGQIIDGFLKQAWVRNIGKRVERTERGWERFFENLDEAVNQNHELTYIHLRGQTGIDSQHAGLVTSVSRQSNGSYSFTFIDSNSPDENRTFNYNPATGRSVELIHIVPGDTTMELEAEYTPYIDRFLRVDRMRSSIDRFCRDRREGN